eukprot:gnl/TRDRNA2_/TRDRNA2_227710_c0_seq1.p1 gnl/TRDRNA2_/TRDRNA2_227710_c0~~gnl/TRDRNA2_/TRDRNA2_227710_c0_seq1.p1  ORF type:complete len:106 (-),score=25.85 gnl/TRDRNA2_/TRDRNA2_227710_c0_seq1:11-292(-)
MALHDHSIEEALATLENNCTATNLSVAGIGIKYYEAQRIAVALEKNQEVTNLDLSCNDISDQAPSQISEAPASSMRPAELTSQIKTDAAIEAS